MEVGGRYHKIFDARNDPDRLHEAVESTVREGLVHAAIRAHGGHPNLVSGDEPRFAGGPGAPELWACGFSMGLGVTLHRQIRRGKPVADPRRLLVDLLTGLEWLHAHHIYHGDIWTSNVLWLDGSDGCGERWALIDYDHAICSPYVRQVYSHHIVRAPEAVLDSKFVRTDKVDVWAAAATVVYAADPEVYRAAVEISAGDYNLQVADRIAAGVVEGARGVGDADLRGVLLDMLDMRPEKRPVVSRALGRLVGSRPSSPASTPTSRGSGASRESSSPPSPCVVHMYGAPDCCRDAGGELGEEQRILHGTLLSHVTDVDMLYSGEPRRGASAMHAAARLLWRYMARGGVGTRAAALACYVVASAMASHTDSVSPAGVVDASRKVYFGAPDGLSAGGGARAMAAAIRDVLETTGWWYPFR